MQSALTTPVLASIAAAGLLLGVGAAATSLSPEPATHRLSLHAVDAPNAFYLSVFRNGDIRVQFAGPEIHSLKFRTYARVFDGCRWVGIETLTPRDGRSFHYAYDEEILSCDPGATPTTKTPRTGIVTIAD